MAPSFDDVKGSLSVFADASGYHDLKGELRDRLCRNIFGICSANTPVLTVGLGMQFQWGLISEKNVSSFQFGCSGFPCVPFLDESSTYGNWVTRFRSVCLM